MHRRVNSTLLDTEAASVRRIMRAIHGAACVLICMIILWGSKVKDKEH